MISHKRAADYAVFRFSIGTLILFLILTLMAMYIYSGGTKFNPSEAGYDFARNFFSDLGRYQTFAGQSNFISMILFSVAAGSAAIGQFLFFLATPTLFTKARGLARTGSFFGLCASLCYLGIALTPADILFVPHYTFVRLAFSLFLPASVFYGMAILRSDHYPGIYAAVFLIFTLILAAYLTLLFFGPGIKTPEGLLIQVVGQKIIVYSQVICMAVQVYGAKTVRWSLNPLFSKEQYGFQS
ncbi:MAG: hypothetical protein HQK54_17425 [Oligoflexales bacterium]|nr:hypothetical protein [Oligoflexales bacterium]